MVINNPKIYFESLSGLRFLCALMVVFHHTLYHFQPNSFLLNLQLGNGSVTLFFVLSGFVLFYRFGNDFDIRKFYLSRFIRLYPLYWFSLILFFVLVGSSHFWMANPTTPQIISTIIGVQTFVPYPRYYFAINPVGWFVSAEIVLCLLYPFLARKFSPHNLSSQANVFFNNSVKVVAVSIILYVVLMFIALTAVGQNEQTENFIYGNKMISQAFLRFNPISRLFQFASGMLLAQFVLKLMPHYEQIKSMKIFAFNSLWLIIGLYFIYYVNLPIYYINSSFSTFRDMYNLTSIGAVSTLASVAVIFCCLISRGWICKFFKSQTLKYLGKISYSIFLFHPILSAVIFSKATFISLPMMGQIVIYFLLLFGFSSVLSWLFEEKLSFYLKQRFLIN